MRWRPALLTILTAVLIAPAAEAAALKVDYRITLGGLTLGQADLSGTFERDRYDLQMKAQLTGMAGLLSGSGRGGASARGSVANVRLVPSGFSAMGQTSSAQRTVQVGIEGGNATRVEINPPFERRTDRVPLTDEHKAGIIDPLSATLVAVPRNSRPGDPANCDRTMPVFDGTLRFDVVLSYVETKRVQKPGYSGDVLVCSVRYVPVAGHRPDLPSVRFMAANQDINVWLAPVEGTRLLAPIRISVATMLGTTVIEAERWSLDRSDLKGTLTR
jgi:hypothetical protein